MPNGCQPLLFEREETRTSYTECEWTCFRAPTCLFTMTQRRCLYSFRTCRPCMCMPSGNFKSPHFELQAPVPYHSAHSPYYIVTLPCNQQYVYAPYIPSPRCPRTTYGFSSYELGDDGHCQGKGRPDGPPVINQVMPAPVVGGPPPPHTGRTRALLIGINYSGSSCEVQGCVNDVNRMKELLVSKFGFSDSPDAMVHTYACIRGYYGTCI
jgi:hypothetical protein